MKYFPGTVEITSLENQSLLEVRKRRLLLVREQDKQFSLSQNAIFRQVIENNKAKRKAARKEEKIKSLVDRMNKLDSDYQDGLLKSGEAHQQALHSAYELKARQERIKLESQKKDIYKKIRNTEAIKIAQEIQSRKVQEAERNQRLLQVRQQSLAEDRENVRAVADLRRTVRAVPQESLGRAVQSVSSPIQITSSSATNFDPSRAEQQQMVQARIIKHGPVSQDKSAIASTVAIEAASTLNRSWGRVMTELVGVVRGRERHTVAMQTLRRTNTISQVEKGLQYLQAEDRLPPERLALPRSMRAIQPSTPRDNNLSTSSRAPANLVDEFERLLLEVEENDEDERTVPQARPPLQLSRHTPSDNQRSSVSSPRHQELEREPLSTTQSPITPARDKSYARPWRSDRNDVSPKQPTKPTLHQTTAHVDETAATPRASHALHSPEQMSEKITPLVHMRPRVAQLVSVETQTSQEFVRESASTVGSTQSGLDEDEAALQVAYRYFFNDRSSQQQSISVQSTQNVVPFGNDAESAPVNNSMVMSDDTSMQSFVRTIQQQQTTTGEPARMYSRTLPGLSAGVSRSDVLRESLGLVEQSLESFVEQVRHRSTDNVSLRRFDGHSSSSSSSPESVNSDVLRAYRVDQEKLLRARDVVSLTDEPTGSHNILSPVDDNEISPSIDNLQLTDRLLASVRQPYVRSYLQSLEQHRRAEELLLHVQSRSDVSSDSSVLSFLDVSADHLDGSPVEAQASTSMHPNLNSSSSSGSLLFEMPNELPHGGPNTAGGPNMDDSAFDMRASLRSELSSNGSEYEEENQPVSEWSMLASQDHFVFR